MNSTTHRWSHSWYRSRYCPSSIEQDGVDTAINGTVPIYFRASPDLCHHVGRGINPHSGAVLLTHLECAYIIWPLAGMLAVGVHICWLTHLECTYIIWPSAGMLAAGVHICWLTHLEHAYIIWPLAGMLAAGVHICQLTRLEHAYITWPSAGTLSVTKHICQLAHIDCAYIITRLLAGMLK